ncbi:hypothetical protein ebA3197 [Aromatoleum aromaticum EbN1]|uniref:Uncharacterized protein n=1 Tax=Aromatoleum aromaticum (strain DSM 19018 / LMG 30748 / EbN1) TaxID=76114 RepID=Q5P438_AROAE|nr:hypothetical protein ebA3197 [Aromatoleum aromaticum EbN1]
MSVHCGRARATALNLRPAAGLEQRAQRMDPGGPHVELQAHGRIASPARKKDTRIAIWRRKQLIGA